MAHTNSTTNYALPQFLPTDKPAWLTDINGAFTTIDTAIDAAKDAADAAQGDATQALTDAGNAATAAATADAKGAGACASIADTFDSTTVYEVGALVMYNSLFYKCTVDVTTPGPWTGSANWARLTVEDLVGGLAGDNIPYVPGDPRTIWDFVESIKLDLSTLFRVESFTSVSLTVGANGALNVTANNMNISHPAGYTPVGIINIYSNNNDVVFKNFDVRASGGSSFGIVRNVGNSAATFTASVVILYAKSTYIA